MWFAHNDWATLIEKLLRVHVFSFTIVMTNVVRRNLCPPHIAFGDPSHSKSLFPVPTSCSQLMSVDEFILKLYMSLDLCGHTFKRGGGHHIMEIVRYIDWSRGNLVDWLTNCYMFNGKFESSERVKPPYVRSMDRVVNFCGWEQSTALLKRRIFGIMETAAR